jgi:hypothetical protein
MHNSIPDQIVVLTMIEHRQVNHASILDRASHHLMVLNAMTIICDRHNTRLRKGADRREFLPCETF